MKKYFAVSFKYSETVYCSNIAHAETVEAVEAHYSKYELVSVRECEGYEVEEARHYRSRNTYKRTGRTERGGKHHDRVQKH